MNRATVIGNLTKDPELRTTPAGKSVCTFTLAVKRPFSKDETDFIPCVVWGPMGENTAKYQTKGKRLGVSGRIQTRSYDTNNGEKRYVTEIVADEVEFLSPMGEGSSASKHQSKQDNDKGLFGDESDFEPLDDEQMPF